MIDTGGGRCVVGSTGVKVVPSDRALASAPKGARGFRDGTADDGAPVRVLTRSAGSGLAVTEARPMGEFQSTLAALAWILARMRLPGSPARS